jgi:hypothetical protein
MELHAISDSVRGGEMTSFPIGQPAVVLYRFLFVFLTCGQFPTGRET